MTDGRLTYSLSQAVTDSHGEVMTFRDGSHDSHEHKGKNTSTPVSHIPDVLVWCRKSMEVARNSVFNLVPIFL